MELYKNKVLQKKNPPLVPPRGGANILHNHLKTVNKNILTKTNQHETLYF